MRLKIASLGILAILVTGCVGTGSVDCAGWRPIRLSDATITVMTRAEAADVLAHNGAGRTRGCW